MFRRGNSFISHQVRNLAECALDFSRKVRGAEEFPSESLVRHALDDSLRLPSIAVIGRTKSGKSTVLASLANEPAFAAGNFSTPAHRWVYDASCAGGKKDESVVSTGFFPCELLLDVELIDTAGLEDPGVMRELPRLLSGVDLVVLALPANEWERSDCWDWLASLSPQILQRMLIALTYADAMGYEDLQMVKDGVRNASSQMLGQELPLFPVTQALPGGRPSPGIDALARRLDGMISAARPQAAVSEAVMAATASLLSEQEKVLRNQERLTRLDAGFLAGIEQEINEMRHRIEVSLPARLDVVCQFVQDCVPRLARKTSRQLGYVLSIGRIGKFRHFAEVIDEWFYELLRIGIEERIEFHNREFLASCRDHWNSVRPRVQEKLDCEIGEFPEETVKNRLDAYRRRLGPALYEPLRSFGVKSCLVKLYAGQERWMRRQIILIFLLLIAAGVLGGLGESLAGLILLACGIGFWVLSAIALIFVRMRLTTQIEDAARELPMVVRDEIQIPLYEAMVSGVVDYRKLYRTLRGMVDIGAEQIAPLLDEHSKMFYKLSAMRQNRAR